MICPSCLNTVTRVLETRGSGSAVRRRRECVCCGKRFTTYESSGKPARDPMRAVA